MSLIIAIRHFFHPQRSNNHRPKILHPEALFGLIFLVMSLWMMQYPFSRLSGKMGAVLGYASNITANDVVTETNNQRAVQGLGPLQINDQLNQAALAKAQNMFANEYWSHIAPDGTEPWKFFQEANYKYSLAGENLARDFAVTNDMMSAWMDSPTHRKNILESRYQDIGVAVVNGNLLGEETTLVVQLFGTPMGAKPSLPSTERNITAPTAPTATAQTEQITFVAQASNNPGVLASTVMPSSLLQHPILLSPIQLSKIFFLAIILLLASTLIYDSFIMTHYSTVRLVGKNLAHLALLMVTAFLLLLFKGGMIG